MDYSKLTCAVAEGLCDGEGYGKGQVREEGVVAALRHLAV